MGNLGVLADEADRFALTSQGRAFVVAFWEFAAFVANSLVFLLIGLALAATPTRSLGALVVVVALALAGRAAAVYPIALLFARSRWAISLARAAFPVVGRLARRAGAGARPLPAARHALPRRQSSSPRSASSRSRCWFRASPRSSRCAACGSGEALQKEE